MYTGQEITWQVYLMSEINRQTYSVLPRNSCTTILVPIIYISMKVDQSSFEKFTIAQNPSYY